MIRMPAKKFSKMSLKRETDRHRTDAESGEQARRGETRHDDDQRDHQADQPDRQLYHRIEQAFQAGTHLRPADQAIRNSYGEFRDEPRDDQNDDRDGEIWQGANEAIRHFG